MMSLPNGTSPGASKSSSTNTSSEPKSDIVFDSPLHIRKCDVKRLILILDAWSQQRRGNISQFFSIFLTISPRAKVPRLMLKLCSVLVSRHTRWEDKFKLGSDNLIKMVAQNIGCEQND